MEILRRGVRFRIGHVMIMIVYCAFVFAAIAGALQSREFRHPRARIIALALVFVAQPHIFRLFILYLGRPSPVRAWFAVQCRSLSDLVIGGFLLTIAVWHVWTGVAWILPYFFVLALVLPALCCWAKLFWMVAITWPRRCPRCRRLGLIPMVELRPFLDGFVARRAECVSCGLARVRSDREGWQETVGPVAPEVKGWIEAIS